MPDQLSAAEHVVVLMLEQTYWNGSRWVNRTIGPAEANSSLAVSGFDGPGGPSEHVFFVGAATTGYVLRPTYGAVWRARTLPGSLQAHGLTSSDYIPNLAEDSVGQQVFFTSGKTVPQTYWDGVAWHTQILPGTAAG